VLVADSGSGSFDLGQELAITATNSGTYIVLVSDTTYGGNGGSGAYQLSFAQPRGPFIVPAGDEGGSLTNGVDVLGTIQPGDLDLFRFTACRGDLVMLRMDALTQTNYFNPWIRLYNPGGILVADSGSGSFAATATIALIVTNAGAFTVVLGDSAYSNEGGSGTYKLTSNGLSDELKLCLPLIAGTNVTLAGIGGGSNATYVLLTHTNVTTPLAFWTPMRTNQFDSFGVFGFTNLYNPAEQQRYFRLRTP
jgi:hypothetical protein